MDDHTPSAPTDCLGTPTPTLARSRPFEWTGCALGLIGAGLLALNTEASRYGWIAFLAANVAAAIFARRIRAYGLLLQQIGFFATSTLGFIRAFWPHL